MFEALVFPAAGFVLGFVCKRNRCLWLGLFGNADRCAHAKLKMPKSHGLCVSALHKMLPSFNVPSAFYAIENHSAAKCCTVLLHHDCIIFGLPLRSPMALCNGTCFAILFHLITYRSIAFQTPLIHLEQHRHTCINAIGAIRVRC